MPEIPVNRLQFRFTTSSGAGGQNVNKVATRVEMRFHVASADWLVSDVRSRLEQQQKGRVNQVAKSYPALCTSPTAPHTPTGPNRHGSKPRFNRLTTHRPQLFDQHPGSNQRGELVISSQEHRTQARNRARCIEKLAEMVEAALEAPKERKAYTDISKQGKERRKDDKRHRGKTKANRRVSKNDW